MSMAHHLRPLRDYRGHAFPLAGPTTTARWRRSRWTDPSKKNPLTFDSYAELRDLFRALAYANDVKAVVIRGAGGNFCSGGDVHEIIGPLTRMTMPELLAFTRMTGDLVMAMRHCPQPIVAAVDGVCAGAGAMVALAADFRIGTPAARTAFLFVRVGLAGCDMGACTLLPRMIGQGRAAELLYTGRAMSADEGAAWGFYSRVVAPECVAGRSARARALARRRSDVRACDDEEAPASGVGDGSRRGDRSRGRSAGDLHADGRFPPCVRRLRRQADADSSRAIEVAAPKLGPCVRLQPDVSARRSRLKAPHRRALRWTSRTSTGRSSTTDTARWRRTFARGRRRRGRARPTPTSTSAVARSSARWARPAGCAIASPRRMAGRSPPSTRARCASPAKRWRYHDGLADFAFAMQGLGSGAITLAGSDAQKARWLPAVAPGHGDRRVRAVGAGCRIRRRGDDHARAPRRRRLGARRLQDLDLERRHRRFLLRVRAHGRGRRRARHLRVPGSGADAGAARSPSASR